MSETVYWCESALIDDAVRDRVTVRVVDGRFDSIDIDADAPAGSVRLPGFTIPGLANAHSHAFHRALRGRTQVGSGSFWTWREVMYRAAERLDPDSYHRLARATFAEMALAGISVVGEFHYLHHQPDGTPYDDANAMGDAVLAAAADVGIRITLLDTLYLHGGIDADGYGEPEGVQRRYCDGTAEQWTKRVSTIDLATTQRVGAAVHSVRAVDPAAMRVVQAWASERGAPVHAHVSEQPAENEQCATLHGATPTGVLHDAGLLDAHFSAVHATHLTGDDIVRYVEGQSTVCLCPTTERDLGDGIAPSTELTDAGVRLSLGSDSHAVVDMFEEARAVELDERLRSMRRGVHSASSLLAMAAANGHHSLGWDDAGAISVGGRADLVNISLDSVRTAGGAGPIETAVFAATAADITHVVVDGAVVVADGRHVSIDVARELNDSIAEVMDT